MAHFYGTMSGSRGEVSRVGGKESGITAHVRGRSVGARVNVVHVDGRDVVRVYSTGGSGGRNPTVLIAEFDASGILETS